MAYKQKKSMIAGTDPVKKAKKDKLHQQFLDAQHEEAVKSTDYLTKTPVGPVATKKKVKKEKPGSVPLDPGFEDPVKIQKLQREGLIPGSQNFVKKKKSDRSDPKWQNADEVD